MTNQSTQFKCLTLSPSLLKWSIHHFHHSAVLHDTIPQASMVILLSARLLVLDKVPSYLAKESKVDWN